MATQWTTATGLLDGEVYHVRVVQGGHRDNRLVERLYAQHKGSEVEVPGHGVFRVDGSAEGLLALLLAHTRVLIVDGKKPGAFAKAG